MAKKGYKNRAKEVAEKVVKAFESGDVSEPMAHMFLSIKKDLPMNSWSWNNRFMVFMANCSDARGYKQWLEADRKVVKGQKAATYILYPRFRKDKETGSDGKEKEVKKIYGFGATAVFDVKQTEGEPLPYQVEEEEFFGSLPLVDVAKKWNMNLTTFDARTFGAAGYFSAGSKEIGMAVANENTFLHELIHAADKKVGNLTENGQNIVSETVAELGATVLARMIGRNDIADEGGAFQYIKKYAEANKKDVYKTCRMVIDRVSEAIQEIMNTAEMA